MNGKLPGRIVIYRDGVSDGQLAHVQDFEIPQIYKAFDLVAPGYKPLVAMVIVKKRGNARFFAQMPTGNMANPPCGTVIDTVVTRAEW
jgi:aubergine-like protein